MTLEEIEHELEFAGVSRGQMVKLLSFCKMNGFDSQAMDRKLAMMGYDPIFAIYDDDETQS